MIETQPAVEQEARTSALLVLNAAFRAVEAKDLNAILELAAEDGVFIDPHYPSPRMVGREAIGEGLRWAFANIRSFRFVVRHAYEGLDGTSAAVEVSSHHVLRGGIVLDFPQVFAIELNDGQIARLQAYEPFGPGGAVGLFLAATRLVRRLRGLSSRTRRTARRAQVDA